ncbi:dolichyl-phosphate-mannose--protein mannosyltransferase [Actinomadura miaoliensis]|uniref:Polyprenol-phosphate-mannose--protein mannosyltransferase n=1 Tax=Actinomadura miaoliensis TaxID=430685 RepID=A0ABP7WP46_9ACTN
MAMTDLAPARASDEPRRTPPLRDRLSPPVPGSALLGWLGPLLVTAFAAFLRFDRLSVPKTVVFDETYYAKDALSLLKFGWEHSTVKDADKLLIKDPNAHIWAEGPSFVAHPPGGKWMIAIGEWLFGATPFGWRFMPALFGTLAVLVLCRVARRMTGSTLLGCAAGLLLALDGLQFVTSRAALLDVFVQFWIIAAFACLVNDRFRSRAELADRIDARGGPDAGSPYGPFLVHGWLIAAGVCLGMACATKWTGVFYVAAFGLMVLFWDFGARRAAGVPRPLDGTLLLTAVPAFVQLVVVAALTYLASWWGWIFRPGGWGRGEVAGSPPLRPFEALPDLWRYHVEMWNFHNGLDSKHPYQSWPWDWPILRRPVAFFYSEPKGGCGEAARCSREILGIGTPALWWGGLIALVVAVGLWLVARDWRAGAILLGYTAGWLSWFPNAFADRTMFLFYTTPMIPFMVLAVVLTLGVLIGPQPTRAAALTRLPRLYGTAAAAPAETAAKIGGVLARMETRRMVGAAIAGAFILVVLANFAYFYPVLAAKVISYDEWHARIWFKDWI